MFNRSVQKIAKVHILAFIEYKKGLKNICIEKIEKKDIITLRVKRKGW